MANSVPRIADAELSNRLSVAGAVLIEGPRACGKTELARRQAASEVLLDIDENARRAMAIDPALVLAGVTPRLIDEWQVEPGIWNHVRRAVDQRGSRGQFILTGSSVPADDITRHTGAGRVSRLRLRTMSSSEMGISTGEISLAGLLMGNFEGCGPADVKVGDLAALICRGGWPGDLDLSVNACLTARVDYLEEIRRVDVSRTDGIARDPANVGRLIQSLARNVATAVSARTLAADVGGEGRPLDSDTVRGYLAALGRLMVVEEQPAWSPRLRSRSVLRKSPKRHFVDPSLAAAALGATPERLLEDLEYLGFLFESMVYRDLAIYGRRLRSRRIPLPRQHRSRGRYGVAEPPRRLVRVRGEAGGGAGGCRRGFPSEVSRSPRPEYRGRTGDAGRYCRFRLWIQAPGRDLRRPGRRTRAVAVLIDTLESRGLKVFTTKFDDPRFEGMSTQAGEHRIVVIGRYPRAATACCIDSTFPWNLPPLDWANLRRNRSSAVTNGHPCSMARLR